ncbi:TlyA family RNA methyltransferase [Bifidobacterium samirii]|uniref:Cell division protein FtsJ n=1 Tax=Bifidobacterium samirii TaxID=2306974 RepID=A0A430FVL0_9BIFI|nr:TlyA family RNA methyltransferase [Bifidobacterium samirii]RSX57818.1 cell division protein FtsJ [Bifidobacterium samirii]
MTQRLDALIVARGLVDSRSKAQRLIRDGHVTVDGRTAAKPSMPVAPDAAIAVDKGDDYVSRGAYKLVGAFDVFGARAVGPDADTGNGPDGGHEDADRGAAGVAFDALFEPLPEPAGLHCLDIGASTGGFTQVLLRRGAAQVVALDVGHDQLDARVDADARVIRMDGVNIRDVTADTLPWRPQMIVSDVSFISLTYVIPVIARIAAPGARIVLLVKPQFEVGREGLGRGGVVADPALRERALADVVACARAHGLRVLSAAPSPIEGTHGNAEYLLYAAA